MFLNLNIVIESHVAHTKTVLLNKSLTHGTFTTSWDWNKENKCFKYPRRRDITKVAINIMIINAEILVFTGLLWETMFFK